MQTAVLEFEKPACHRTAHPESPEPNSQKSFGSKEKWDSSTFLPVWAAGQQLMWEVLVPQDERDGEAAPRWRMLRQDPCPPWPTAAAFHFL